MKNKIIFFVVLSAVSLSIVSCTTLTESQIVEAANEYAVQRGLQVKDYEVSVAAPGLAHANMPMKIKSITNASAVTYIPLVKNKEGYTFYIDRNNGKLVFVMKRK